ncbi:lipopolysaccharide biosynthesis protein [Leucobacter salsicius]|uniref:lipopolysaccharide biosynthesis protein n=1 Tax=Leucobacter salsicius TaxID=664638 RepID=UPI000346A153|nr:lipopolysaccharide biosynthesis protein [Leucobacter salsicius]
MSAAQDLAHSAARGAVFTMGAQLARILLQLLSVVVLARLLTPHDYGLLAIALVIVGIGEIFRDFGLTSAAVQAPVLSNGQRDNLFWINSSLGVFLAIIVFLSAWPITWVSGQDELLVIVQALSLVFVLNGLATQYRAQLMRALGFTALAIADVVSAAVALVIAVGAAVLGAGYWALVYQQLATAAILLIMLVWFGRWRPGMYSRQHKVGELVRFGWHLVATNLITYGAAQVDTILVAAKFGTAPLGFYNRAYQIVMTPLNQIRSPITNVALPVFSRAQEDRERFNSFVVAGQLALGYSLGVPLLLVCGLAEPVVAIMLGAQWEEATPVLRFFAIAGTLTTLSFVGYWVYVSRGLSKQLLQYSLVSTAIRLICIVGGSFFGVVGIAAGFALAPALAWPLSIFWLSRVTDLPVRALYTGASRILLVSATGALAAWAASEAVASAGGPWLSLGCGLAAAAAAIGLLFVVPQLRRDAATLRSIVKLMVQGRRKLQD